MDDRDYPDFPLTGPQDDDEAPLTSEGEDFFLTSNDNEDEAFLTAADDNDEPEAPQPRVRRPMFERITPPPNATLPRGVPNRPRENNQQPIPRPTRTDPRLLEQHVADRRRTVDPRMENHRLPRVGERRPRERGERDPRTVIPPTQKRDTRRKRFAAFYILALVVGITACLLYFLFSFQGFRDNQAVAATPAAPTPTPEAALPPDARTQLAQIVAIDVSNPDHPVLELRNLTTGLSQAFYYLESTAMTNVHGRAMVFAELALGQLLDIGFDARTNNLLFAHQSRRAWERRAQQNLRIDLENDTITAGNDVFSFSHHQTMVLYRGEPLPISHLEPVDTVTLWGYGERVWLIQLDAGHGFLQVINTDRVNNGTISIGTQHFLSLFELGILQLHEGSHRVVIDGQNIETYVRNIDIRQGHTTVLDLADVELTISHLHIATVPYVANIYINGERHYGGNVVPLSFGEHTIRVESEGFHPHEQTVTLLTTQASILFELEPLISTGTLRIITIPAGAQIFVNNVFVGQAEVRHETELGPAIITARMAGHDEVTTSVVVFEGETLHTILLPATIPQHTPFPTPAPTPLPIPTAPPEPPLPTPTPTPTPYTGNPFPTPTPPVATPPVAPTPPPNPIPTPPPLA